MRVDRFRPTQPKYSGVSNNLLIGWQNCTGHGGRILDVRLSVARFAASVDLISNLQSRNERRAGQSRP